jgi:NAD(P)-dependent dehydrogenase (short-subunit alcohol dehydrogenase family)
MNTAWDADAEQWQRHFEVNVTGAFVMAQAVGEHLKRGSGGVIVNVASNCGKVGYPNMAAYNASKAALINLTRSLSVEWAADAINVNAVCPGGVDTAMLADVAAWLSPRLQVPADELLGEMGPAQLGRRIAPIEVGRVIAFLLSDDAQIIRGQAINVDGGDTPY